MKQHLLSLVVAAALIVSGCRSNHQPLKTETIGPVPPGNFLRAWTTDLQTNKDPVDRIFLREDAIFVYTRGSASYVVNRSGGDMRFIHQIATTGGILRPPLVQADKIIYPTATTLEIYKSNGRHLRTMALPNSTHGPAAGNGETVYVSLDYPLAGRVGAVDMTRDFNIMKWELYTRTGVQAAPAIFEKTIFFGTEDGTVYAVGEDRSPVWGALPGNVFKTYGGIIGDIRADDFGVYIASQDSKLYCVDRAGGQVKWQYFADQALDATPAITATSVYQFVPGKGIVALDKTTGSYNRKPRWNVRDAQQFLAEDATNAYLRRRDNIIVAVDKASGEERFTSRTSYDFYATNEKDAMIYAVSRSGTVAAIRPVLTPGQVGVFAMNTMQMPIASNN